MATNFTLIFPEATTITSPGTQSSAGAGAFTFPSSPYVIQPGVSTTLAFISTDDNSGTTFTINGIDAAGYAITEDLVGPNNETVYSVNAYAEIVSVTSDGAFTDVEISTGNSGYSNWIAVRGDKLQTAYVTVLDDDIEYSLQITPTKKLDLSGVINNNVNTPLANYSIFPTTVTDETASAVYTLDGAANAIRFIVDSGGTTNTGSLKFELVQSYSQTS